MWKTQTVTAVTIFNAQFHYSSFCTITLVLFNTPNVGIIPIQSKYRASIADADTNTDSFNL